MKRIILLAALCLALAACFKSERLLLDLGAAAHPVAEGDWVSGEGSDVAFSLSAKDDHYLRVEDKNRYDVVIVPLAGHPDTYVAAESSEGCTGHDATPECNWEYAIVVVAKDGTWKQFAPDCKQDWEGMDKDVAKREDDGETCWFDDAAGLQHALAIAADRGGTEQVFHRPGTPAPDAAAPEATTPAEPQPGSEPTRQ
jgi:hypothetical protein